MRPDRWDIADVSIATVSERIVFIVPAFNEQASVGAVVRDLRAHFPTADVVVVNDGSTDATSSVARQGGARVLDIPVNLGVGAAVQTGLLFAARNGCDLAVQVDGDGQHPANQIEALLRPIREGQADAVIGSRFLRLGYEGPLTRRIGTALLNGVNTLLLRRRFTDATSGFRAYGRRAIALLATKYADDYPEPESILVLIRHGLRIVEVPVEMKARHSGSSSITFVGSIYYMLKVFLAILVNATRKVQRQEEDDESPSADHRDRGERSGRTIRF